MRPENVRELGREWLTLTVCKGRERERGRAVGGRWWWWWGGRSLIGIGFNKYQPINVIEVLKLVVESLSIPI